MYGKNIDEILSTLDKIAEVQGVKTSETLSAYKPHGVGPVFSSRYAYELPLLGRGYQPLLEKGLRAHGVRVSTTQLYLMIPASCSVRLILDSMENVTSSAVFVARSNSSCHSICSVLMPPRGMTLAYRTDPFKRFSGRRSSITVTITRW